MKRWLLLLYFPLSSYAQCDLELLDFNSVNGLVTVAFHNTNGCGGTGGPDGVSEIQFGFQAVDEDCNAMNIGWDFPFEFSISGTNNHPGWIFSSTTTELGGNWTNLYDDSIDPPYYTGDTVSFPVFNSYQNDCVDGEFSGFASCELSNVIDYWASEGYSIQVVIWQISYGPTMYSDEGGWAEVGGLGGGVTPDCCGFYEDEDFLDNWIVVGPCGEPLPEVVVDTVYIELPADTVVIVEYDTLYIELPPDTILLVEYDTTFVELPPDTILLVEYDTTYIELPPISVVFWDTVYVTLLDTIIVEVDCETGQECLEVIECPIYAPNAFTPDNDGVNDTWFIEAPNDCWDNVYIRVYSRWGDLVWVSKDFSERWDGGFDKAYVRDDVYVYHFVARNIYSNQWVERTGHVLVLR
jgi:gliding motility-associated-like protein